MSRTTRPLRCDPPIEVWDALKEMADAKGQTMGTYLRLLLIDHVEQTKTAGDTRIPASSTPVEVEWARVSAWFAATGITAAMLKEHGCKTKTDALAWARKEGFEG